MTWVPITKKVTIPVLQVHEEECQRDPNLRTDYVDRNSDKRGPSDDIRMASSSSCFFLSSSSFFFLQLNCCGLRFGFVLSPIQWMGWLPPTKTIDPSNQVGILHGKISQTSRSSPITLPETNSSHLQGSYPKRKRIFQPSIFRCELLVWEKVFVCDPPGLSLHVQQGYDSRIPPRVFSGISWDVFRPDWLGWNFALAFWKSWESSRVVTHPGPPISSI